MWIEIVVCTVASLGAGLGTGLAGLSAASVISPMLITFLGVPAYQAIGIALASDVLASAVSAYIYGKNKHLDLRNGLVMMIFVLFFTYVGSLVSAGTSNEGLGVVTIVLTFLIGMKFLLVPSAKLKKSKRDKSFTVQFVKSAVCGSAIGFVCGFVGAGGGMMMLIVLTSVLGYELKTAVGTSVFVMSFTAFTGSVTHFVLGGVYDWGMLGLCILATCLFAQLASAFANRVSEITMNRVTGALLAALGVGMFIFRLL